MKYFALIYDSTVLPTPPVREEENDTLPPTPVLDLLCSHAQIGKVTLEESMTTDLLIMGYDPCVFAEKEGDKPEEDTALPEENPETEDDTPTDTTVSETDPDSAENTASEEDTSSDEDTNPEDEPLLEEGETASADREHKQPLPFFEKWGLKACYITDLKPFAENAETIGLDTVYLDRDVVSSSEGEMSAPVFSDAVQTAYEMGYELVYLHLTKLLARIDRESLALLDSELGKILHYCAKNEDACRILLVTEAEDDTENRPYILAPLTESNSCESLTDDTTVADGALLFQMLVEKEPADAAEKMAEEPKEEPNADEEEKENKKPISHTIFEWIELFGISLAVVLVLMTFFVRHSPVNGTSMFPTLSPNDVLLISRVGYTPQNGDIVILQTPQYDLRRPLVKRIIALGGQTVRIDFDTWEIYVDGELVKEDYINKTSEPMERYGISDYFDRVDAERKIYEATVPEGHIFVMGDNRNNSQDSRTLGFIDERYIIGDVKLRLLPFSSAGDVD